MKTTILKNKIALVTGGGEGLGKTICQLLAQNDAQVLCSDLNIEAAEKTAAEINAGNPANVCQAVELDVSNKEQITSVVKTIHSSFGHIDYLFNNAGIMISGEIRDLQTTHWEKVINVNLMGLIHCTGEVFRIMSEAKQGHIVNITSVSGLLNYTALNTPYAVSKHGAVTFSKALRLEGEDLNVKVTTICPGAIRTQIGHNLESVNANEGIKQKSIAFIEKGISAEAAAKEVLKATLKNKKLYVFPAGMRVFLYFTKLFPFLEPLLVKKMLKDFRDNGRLQ